MSMRWTAWLLLVATLACSHAPASPTAPATLTPAPAANIIRTTQLTYTCLGATLQCSFTGQLQNVGDGCAANVQGISHVLDARFQEVAAIGWRVNDIVRPTTRASYSGCCFDYATGIALLDTGGGTDRAEIAFTTVPCS
jgi:hypothetical protein